MKSFSLSCRKWNKMEKHVLITGGSGGIGNALVTAFSKAGYAVSFTYNSSEKIAKRLSEETGAVGYRVDFSDVDSVIQFGKRFGNDIAPVDVLINNAGVAHYGVIQDVTPETFQQIFAVNFQSSFFLTRQLISGMISRQSGSIINIASIWGETGGSCEVLYSSTKGAMISFTKALAKELAPSLIAVNCISPGVVDTPMMDRFSADEKNELVQEIPVGHFVRPCEIAELALYLANQTSASLTGQIIGMNGGMYC